MPRRPGRHSTSSPKERESFHVRQFVVELEAGDVDAFLTRLRSFDAQGYSVPYEADGRTLVKVGVEFDKAARNIGRWVVA